MTRVRYLKRYVILLIGILVTSVLPGFLYAAEYALGTPSISSGNLYVIKGQTPDDLQVNVTASCRVPAADPMPTTTLRYTYKLKKDGTTVHQNIIDEISPSWGSCLYDVWNPSGYYEDICFFIVSHTFEMPDGPGELETGAYTLEVTISTPARPPFYIIRDTATTSFDYTVFSGKLDFGPVETQMASITLRSTTCASDYYLQSVTGIWITNGWGNVSYTDSPSDICADSTMNPDGYSVDLSVVSGSVDYGGVSGTAAGIDISLNGGSLNASGMYHTGGTITLADDITLHDVRADGRINPNGMYTVSFTGGGPLTDPQDITVNLMYTNPVYFHSYGLPFYVKTSKINFKFDPSSAGIALNVTNPSVQYVHQTTLDNIAADDYRRLRGLPSNDVPFSKGSNTLSTPYITGNGLSADLQFEKSIASAPGLHRLFWYLPMTHFPKGRVQWNSFRVIVQNGDIQPFVHSNMAFYMGFSGECPEGNCGDPLESASYVLKPDAGVTEDGSFGGVFDGSNFDKETRWGKFENSAGLYTYEKDDINKTGVLFFPGFIVPKSEASSASDGKYSVSQYLFGSRSFKDPSMPSDIHYLNDPNDSTASDGNQYFAGLNIGPQTLEPVDPGFTELIDTSPLFILFNGQSSPIDFSVTDYTKYVIRKGGITGVFNTDFSGTIEIYNYKLEMRRFAFRQVMNEMDEETFIDGEMDLPFPAGLHIAFSSLDITCTGDFAGGQIETEACDEVDNDGDGLIDEGCGEALEYWNIPVNYLGMEFKDQGTAGVCPNPNNRKLYLDTLNDVNGVNNKLTLGAFWNPDGTPEEDNITAASEMWMDSPDGSVESGFSVQLRDGYLDHPSSYSPSAKEGFTNLVTKMDVPLFNDLAIHSHLKNKSPDPEDDSFDLYLFEDNSDNDGDFDGVPDSLGYSVSQYRDFLDDDDETLANDPRPQATYKWPSSGIISLEYPLLYNRASGSEGPQFIGVKQDTNLPEGSDPVIGVYSVPDYINPERTKLSFGVSADIAALSNFHVDLSSLGGIDSFLSNYLGIDSLSLEGLLSGLSSSTEGMHDATGGDITSLLGGVMDGALNASPLSDGIETLSGLIGDVHKAPSLIVSQVESLIDQARGDAEDLLTAGLGSMFSDLYNTDLAALVVYSESTLDNAVQDGFITPPGNYDDLRNQIHSIVSEIGRLKSILEDAKSGLTGARNAVEDVRTEVGGSVSQVAGILSDISNALDNLSDYTSPDPGTNPLLGPLNEAQGYIDSARSAIGALDLGAIGDTFETAASAVGGSIDTQFLSDAEQFFDDRVDELDTLITNATDNLTQLLTSAGLGTVFDDAKDRLNFVQTHVNTLDTTINDIFGLVLDSTDGVTPDNGYIGLVENGLGALIATLGSLEDIFSDLSGETITGPVLWADMVNDGKENLNILANDILSNLSSEGGDLGTTAGSIITGSDPFTDVVVNNLMALIDAPIAQAIDAFTSELDSALEDVMAFIPDPDADDIREFIKSAVLNSEPVQNVNNSFFAQFGFISDYIDDLSGELTGQINSLINEAVEALQEGLSSQMADITSGIGGTGGGLDAAKIDGYAIVSQEEVERFHLEAELKFSGDPDPTVYFAALDITSWNAENGKGSGCSMDGTGFIDVAISTRDVSADMLGCSLGIKEALLGFTLNGPLPIGIFGYVYTSGELSFEVVVLYDMGLEFGIGAIENYLGAKATGRFESYTISAAFYFGRCCDYTVLKRLDPEVAEFLGERDGLTGVYVRGSAEVPIWNYSCMLKVGVGCDIGAWYFADPPPTFGGLLGGSAYGRVACLAALKGKITCIGAKTGDQYNFSGSGWGAGGLGFCEPEDWKDISSSRSDSWCLTGDASFSATYKGGWSIDGPSVDCCF